MTHGIGKLTAFLADSDETVPSDVVGMINERVAPPDSLKAEDVYVRAMYVVSDSVNSFGGRFPGDEHARLAELLVDSPVLVGHRKDRLPVARTFHAETIMRNGRPWVRSYFYWPKKADHANELKEKIDGGIVKECSISFTFHLPECSVCGRDIRLCPHEPFEKVQRGSEKTVCHFNYRKIERVLETSLVYRGAIPDTGISKPLENARENENTTDDDSSALRRIDSLRQLDDDREYLIIPRYEGIPLTPVRESDSVRLVRDDGDSLPDGITARFDRKALDEGVGRPARLVGYQGKRRCSSRSLERFLAGDSSTVSRLVLFLYPDDEREIVLPTDQGKSHEVKLIPHRRTVVETMDTVGGEIMTRLGVEIWPLPIEPGIHQCHLYVPQAEPSSLRDTNPVSVDDKTVLVYDSPSASVRQPLVTIHAFDRTLLDRGRMFIADVNSRSFDTASSSRKKESVVLTKRECGYLMKIGKESSVLFGSFLLRPIKLNGKKRYLLRAATIKGNREEPECG